MSGYVIGVLGAESTGKTVLAAELAQAMAVPDASCSERAPRVALVTEWLREFCILNGRTPRADEQRAIADAQAARIEAATATHDIVIADTTSLMIAVYSEIVFGDKSLYASACAQHRRCDLTLLTALDVPWHADGLQRDGPHVREPVDALVRAALNATGVSYAVISGLGPARVNAALASVRVGMRATSGTSGSSGKIDAGRATQDAGSPSLARWITACERCGDAACERHLLLSRHGRAD